MKKNVNKLIAASLVTTMGLGYINYPVQAQEETEVNVPSTIEETETVLNTDNDSQNTFTEQPKESEESNEDNNSISTNNASKLESIESKQELKLDDKQIQNVVNVTINGTTIGYNNINDAFAACNGQTATVTLLDNVTSTNYIEIDNANITFVGGDYQLYSQGNYIDINNSTFTLESGYINHNGVLSLTIKFGSRFIMNGGKVNDLSLMDGICDLYGGVIGFLSNYRGTINVYSGTIQYIDNFNGSINYYYTSPTPTYDVSTTKDSITVNLTNYDSKYGFVGYAISKEGEGPNGWQQTDQSTIEFTSLESYQKYDIFLYYKGKGNYLESEETTFKVTTKNDGSTLITEPSNLTAIYGQKLSDISLPEGWVWVNGDTSLSVGKQTYTVRFDTTNYENEYDFSTVEGYNNENHNVERNLTVNVSKANTTLTIATDNMDKAYDGNPVAEPSVNKTGSTKEVTFTWYIEDGDNWTELSSAPKDSGSYKLIASVEADENYNEAKAEKEFSISQTTNEWTSELSIADWTYGKTASTPVATAKYGNVVFTYSDKEDGTYTGKVPTEAGTWYVKATVEGNENYTGLETTKQFTINKANSTIAFKDAFSLDKTYDTNPVTINIDEAVDTTGSKGNISFVYEKNVNGTWQELSSSPTGAGTYQVTAKLDGDTNYNEASSQPLEFTISKTDSSVGFTTDSLDKTYDGKSVFVGTKQEGSSHARVLTWYKDNNGVWEQIQEAPTNAGSYKVVATVEGDDNYNGAKAEMIFEIYKAQPSYTLPTDLVIKQGDALSTVSLPDGFAWIDDTQTVDVLGTHTFQAVFTPEDTTNYKTVEVEIRVEVVPAISQVDKAPVIHAEDKTLTVGDTFDAMKGVTATDAEDGDLTDKIVIAKNTVDTSKAGKYTVVYEVMDSHGTRVVRTIYVTVQQKTTDTGKEDSNKDSAKDTAQTSTQTNILAWSVLGIASLGALLVALFKRKRH